MAELLYYWITCHCTGLPNENEMKTNIHVRQNSLMFELSDCLFAVFHPTVHPYAGGVGHGLCVSGLQ